MSISNDEMIKWINALKKEKEQSDLEYAKFTGIIQGVRSRPMTQTDEAMLALIELIIKNDKGSKDLFNQTYQIIVVFLNKIETLEKEVKDLKRSMDTLDQNR